MKESTGGNIVVSSYRNIWKVAYPIIAGNIAQNLINLADTAFLGRLSPLALGAAGNAIIFYYLFIVVGMGMAIGAEILVGRRNGEGRFEEVGRLIDHGFYLLIPLSFALFLVLYYFSEDLMRMATANPEIAELGMEYLNYRMFGIFFAFANLGFRIFYVGTTNTSILTWSTSLMAAVNIALDYTLIYGHFGFPALGVKGAAIASVIAEGSAFAYFVIHTQIRIDKKKYGLLKFRRPDAARMKNLLRVSAPITVQHFFAVGSWMLFFLIIEKMGAEALAISHIIRSIYMVLMIPIFGFSAATSTLVSNLIGMGRSVDVLPFIVKVVKLTLLSTAFILPFNLAIPEEMISFFTDNTRIISETIPVLYIITGSMFMFSVSYIIFSAVSGSGNTQVSMVIELSTLVIYIASAVFFAFGLEAGLPVVWCSEFVYFGMMGLLSISYLRFGNWRKKVI